MAARRKKGPAGLCTQTICNTINAELAKGRTLTSICKDAGMPGASTVLGWAHNDVEVIDERAENPDQLTTIDRSLIANRRRREARAAALNAGALSPTVVPFRQPTGSTKSEHRTESSGNPQIERNKTNKAQTDHHDDNLSSNTIGQRIDSSSSSDTRKADKADKANEFGGDEVTRYNEHYARAREIGYHALADDLLDEADNDANDYDAHGNPNHAAIQRSRLKVDARKWLLSKALPRLYGDRIDPYRDMGRAPDVILTGNDVDL